MARIDLVEKVESLLAILKHEQFAVQRLIMKGFPNQTDVGGIILHQQNRTKPVARFTLSGWMGS